MSTSVGYTSAFNGGNVMQRLFVARPGSSGGAIRGYMPPMEPTTNKQYPDYEHIRFTLKNAWNTSHVGQLRAASIPRSITTPFRAVNNAGDLLARKDYACGGGAQPVQSRPNLHGLSAHVGHTGGTCVPSVAYNSLQMVSAVPAANCNGKYVYDASDYTTYLKQRATLRNYNALKYGGDEYHANQSVVRAVRRR